MKIIIILLFLPILSYSQQLSIDETFKYIENIENVYLGYNGYLEGKLCKVDAEYHLDENGILTKQTFYKSNSSKILKSEISVHVDDLKRQVKYAGSLVSFECKTDNCITSYEGGKKIYSNYGLQVLVQQEYEAKKIIRAINYLFSLIDNLNFNRDTDDPFAVSDKKVVTVTNSNTSKSNLVKLNENNGVYTLSVKFGTITKIFVLDSGASEITISNTLENELIKNGIIKKEDYLPDALYKIADGSIINQRRVVIKNLSVGEFNLKNISASIGNENTPLLLGRNFLGIFKTWSIDNQKKLLELSY